MDLVKAIFEDDAFELKVMLHLHRCFTACVRFEWNFLVLLGEINSLLNLFIFFFFLSSASVTQPFLTRERD